MYWGRVWKYMVLQAQVFVISLMKLYQLASVGRSQLGWQHARVCGF